jgi:hypothetical protein
VAEVGECLLGCAIRGEATAGQGSGVDGVEATQGDEVVLGGDDNLFCIATVDNEANFGGVRTDHLLARAALRAVVLATSPGGVDDDGPEAIVDADDFVAQDAGKGDRIVAVDDVEV